MIKLDNKPLSTWGLYLLRGHIHPMTPDMRQKLLTIPGKDGKWDFGSEWDSRTFELPVGIIENDKYELQRKLNEFVVFLLDSFGKPRDIKLVFDYEPDKYYLVRFAGSLSPERLFKLGKFPLTLIAHDPYKKFMVTSNDITMDSDVPVMSDVLWDTGIHNFHVISSQSISILNNGTVAIPLSFTVDGSGTNVTFTVNEKSFSLGDFIDSTFQIIGESYTVIKNGVEDLTSFSGDFLQLMPGENIIEISGTDLDLTITENNQYKYI